MVGVEKQEAAIQTRGQHVVITHGDSTSSPPSYPFTFLEIPREIWHDEAGYTIVQQEH